MGKIRSIRFAGPIGVAITIFLAGNWYASTLSNSGRSGGGFAPSAQLDWGSDRTALWMTLTIPTRFRPKSPHGFTFADTQLRIDEGPILCVPGLRQPPKPWIPTPVTHLCVQAAIPHYSMLGATLVALVVSRVRKLRQRRIALTSAGFDVVVNDCPPDVEFANASTPP